MQCNELGYETIAGLRSQTAQYTEDIIKSISCPVKGDGATR